MLGDTVMTALPSRTRSHHHCLRTRHAGKDESRTHHLIFGSVPDPRSVKVAPLASRYVIMCDDLESGSVARPSSRSVSTPVVRSRTHSILWAPSSSQYLPSARNLSKILVVVAGLRQIT